MMQLDLAEGDPDLALLRGFTERGDRAALEALFSRHADCAYRFALRICRRPADAEDILQSAFLEILHHASSFRGESSVKSWLLGFVLNASRSQARQEVRRRRRHERAAEVRESGPAVPVVDPETADRVRRAVDDLPERYRAPVWLHFAEGLTPAQVGEILNLPAGTVRKQLSRGIDRLREALLPAGIAGSVVAILPALAVETAPPSAAIVASLPAVSAASPAGFAPKIAAATVAALALCSTATFLWWGVRLEDERPPELAEIERRVREWQPTADERRFDEIGWVPDLRSALRLSRESGRPVFLLTQSGRINLGRSDGGSQFLRPRALADSRIIGALNAQFVPVYLSNADVEAGTAAPEEERLRDRVWADARKAGLPSGMDGLYILDPTTGRVRASSGLGEATPEAVLALLDAHRIVPPGPAMVRPAPQSVPPPAPSEALTLHLTARYLDETGAVERERSDYHEVPAEDWIVLGPDDWRSLLPSAGETREVNPVLARRLLTHVHPSDISVAVDPNKRNRFEEVSLRVVRFSRTYVRLEGRLRMRRSFTQAEKTAELPVTASLRGVLEIEPDGSRIRSLRMITDGAFYGLHPFGVAVRSVP